MSIFDYLCLIICVIHLFCIIYEFVHGIILGKKLDKICSQCGYPIYTGEDHICASVLDSSGNLRCFTDVMLRDYADILNKVYRSNNNV